MKASTIAFHVSLHCRWRRTLLLLLIVVVGGCTGSAAFELPEPAGAQRLADGDPARGWQAVQSYGCHACHVIPGVPGANSLVGPPLTAWAERQFIAGKLPNEPEYLIQWIRYPQAIEPGTAMPNMGVTEQDAQDIGAYLYTLHQVEPWHRSFLRTLGLSGWQSRNEQRQTTPTR